jgi:tagaturonate reductase
VFAGLGLKEQAEAYRATVVERFSNPFLDHRLAEILINHEAKKQRRFGGLIELAKAHNLRVKQPRLRAALASEIGNRVPHPG